MPVQPLTSKTVKSRQCFNRLSIAVKTQREQREGFDCQYGFESVLTFEPAEEYFS